MTPNQLKGLLASARRGDDRDFQNTAEALAKQLRSFHSSKADQALGAALNDFAIACKALAKVEDSLPGSSQSAHKEGVTAPRIGFDDLRLPRHIGDMLESLLLELNHPEAFAAHNVRPTRSLLLHGESGTGKTSIAHAIAKETNRDLRVALASDLESQYMGQTSRQLADFIRGASFTPCVLLLDECDTLLHSRHSRGNTAREEGSITNTLLQQMDSLHPNILLIATTNLLPSVDPAAMRRFDHILEIPLPSEKAIRRRAAELATKHKINANTIAELDLGHNYATCERAILCEVRRQIAHRLRG